MPNREQNSKLVTRNPQLATREGSVLILVIVALVLMVMLGAVYLQTARVQRFAVATVQGDMNAEIAAIMAQIQTTLANDLTTQNSINPEPYDYGWTNTNKDWDPVPTKFDGSPATGAKGGDHDDTWLASSAPTFSSGNDGKWRHITNLNGIFLRYAGNSTNAFTLSGGLPQEYVVDFSTPATNSDTDQTLIWSGGTWSSPELIDADGDGIPDSRWTWGAIKQITGVTYVMAVRIVDLSGMVNVNTATSLGTFGSPYTYDHMTDPDNGINAPRWETPSELDLGSFVNTLGGGSPEFLNMLGYRIGAAQSNTLLSAQARYDFWNKTGRYYPASATPTVGKLYTLDDEYELRYRNGLNNKDHDATIESSADGMNSFLRAGATETLWSNAKGTLSEYFQDEPRHQMTTMSGVMDLAQQTDGSLLTPDSNSTGNFKVDLNPLPSDTPAQFIKRVADRVFDVTNDQNFADQFAVNLYDYIDIDGRDVAANGGATPATAITKYAAAGGKTYYGFEALPFIAEVYVEGKYPAPAAPGQVTVGGLQYWDLNWTLEQNPGFAIEIRNPFPYPIDLQGVHLYVDGTDWGALSDTNLSGNKTLKPREVLILFQHAGDGSTVQDKLGTLSPGGLVMQDSTTEYSKTYTPREVSDSLSWPTVATATKNTGDTNPPTLPDVKVELRASVHDATSTGSAVTVATWAYDKVTSVKVPKAYEDKSIGVAANPTAPTQTAYWQVDRSGDGRALAMLALKDTDFAKSENIPGIDPDSTAVPPAFTTFKSSMYQLGKAYKQNSKISGDPATDPSLAKNEQIIVGNRGMLFSVGELANILDVGPGPSQTDPTKTTMAEAWGGLATPLAAHLLNFGASASVPVSDPNAVSPAAFLIDQFTTLAPETDVDPSTGVAIDNDGDKTSGNEHIIPGLVNLNTAPPELLNEILPIPNTALRNSVMAAIVKYRANATPATDRPSGVRANPGIAYTGELFNLITKDAAANALATDGNDNYALPDGTNGTTPNVRVDFLGNPPVDASNPNGQDNISNDAEEKHMIASWLAQVGSVRSDYFAAYVLVRGYDASTGFNAAGVVDAARFIAIFKRDVVSGKVSVQAVLPSSGPYMVK